MNNLDLGVFSIPNTDHINTTKLEKIYDSVLIDFDNICIDRKSIKDFIKYIEKNKSVLLEKNIYFKYFELLDEKGELTGKIYTGTDYLNVNFKVVFRNAKISELLNEIENNGLRGISFFFDCKFAGYNSNGLSIQHFDIMDGFVYQDFGWNIISLDKTKIFEPINYVFNDKQIMSIFKNGLTHQELIKFFNVYKINNPFADVKITVGWAKPTYSSIDIFSFYERDLIENMIEFELNTCDYIEFYSDKGFTYYIDYEPTEPKSIKWKIHKLD